MPVPKIKELNKALKGHAKSYEIELQDNLNSLNHFTKTRPLTESHLENLLKTMKGFKFIETLEVTFEKDSIDSKTGKRVSIYKTAFFNGKAKIVTKVDDIEPELNMSRQEILNVIDKWVSKIKELNKALKGHAKSYEIELQDNLNSLNHFTKTRPLTESHLENLLKSMKGFKFIETLEVTFEKNSIDSKTGKHVSIYKTAFFNGKAKIVTKVDDIEPELNMSRQEILNVIDKWVSEGSGWVIDRIDSHYLNVTL